MQTSNPKLNGPLPIDWCWPALASSKAVDPGTTAGQPAGVYYASVDSGRTTFFRARCGGDRKQDVVLRTFSALPDGRAVSVTSLQLFGGKLYFTDTANSQVWECDTDMVHCHDLHVNKILKPATLTSRPAATAPNAEQAVYADTAYNAIYSMPLPTQPAGTAVQAAAWQPVLLRACPRETMVGAADMFTLYGGDVLLWRTSHVIWQAAFSKDGAVLGAPTLFFNATARLNTSSKPRLLAVTSPAPRAPAIASHTPLIGTGRRRRRRRKTKPRLGWVGALPPPAPPPSPSPAAARVWMLSWHASPPQMLVHHVGGDGKALRWVADIYPWYKAAHLTGLPFAMGAGTGEEPNLYFVNSGCRVGLLMPGGKPTTLDVGIGADYCAAAKSFVVVAARHTGSSGEVTTVDELVILTRGASARNYGELVVRVRVDPKSGRVIATTKRSLPGTRNPDNFRPTTTYGQVAVTAAGATVLAVTGVLGRLPGTPTQAGLAVWNETQNAHDTVPLVCSSLRVVSAQVVGRARAQGPGHTSAPAVGAGAGAGGSGSELVFVDDQGDQLHTSSVDRNGRLLSSLHLKTHEAASVTGSARHADRMGHVPGRAGLGVTTRVPPPHPHTHTHTRAHLHRPLVRPAKRAKERGLPAASCTHTQTTDQTDQTHLTALDTNRRRRWW